MHGVLDKAKMQYGKDREKAINPVKVQDLTFRDGHQSIFATRGRTEDMLQVAEMMDEIGFFAMEVWGGATFDTMHRFLNEDPWERLRTLKKYIKKTPFSMLLRGQNLVGYRNYADDVVRAFVERAAANGVDIFRVFDALNDFRNFETAVETIKKSGKHFQGTICYSLTEKRMGGDLYNLEYYCAKAEELAKMGADSICIKDMAGLIAPYDAFDLISALKKTVQVPLHLHTHFTSGMGDLSIFKAIEAGVDIVDTAMSPYAYRTSHAAIEPLVVSLYGTSRDTGFDIEALAKIADELEKAVPKYLRFLDNTKLSIIDTNVILHQTPGGMLSNLVNQLKQMDAIDKLPQVFQELPKVRKDLGMVPLVTPTSQIVGTQTVNNVLFDTAEESYTHITEQVKDLCFGLYGKTPRAINPELQAKALKNYPRGENPITCRPGDTLEPELAKIQTDVKNLAKDLDDELIVALYPVTGKRFLRWKYGLEPIPDDVKPVTMSELENKKTEAKLENKEMPAKPENIRVFDVFVDGEYFKVEVAEQGGKVVTTSRPQVSEVKQAAPQIVTQAPKAASAPLAAEDGTALLAPIPGMISEVKVQVGDKVTLGDTVIVLEAMKMYNNIAANVTGKIKSINVKPGDSVAKNQPILIIG